MSRAAKLRLIDRPHELNLISTYSDPLHSHSCKYIVEKKYSIWFQDKESIMSYAIATCRIDRVVSVADTAS